MKATRLTLFLLAAICLATAGLAQSSGPTPRKQEKIAEKYQKSIKKRQHKQEKVQAKQLKKFRKAHPEAR